MRRLSVPVYVALYAALLAWFVLAGLHLTRGSFWVPVFFMMVLDWFMTRDTQLRYVLAAFMMLAVFAIIVMRFFVAPDMSLWAQSVCDVGAFLAAFAGYQVLLWRVVLRRPA